MKPATPKSSARREPHWRPCERIAYARIPPDLRCWLLDPASLTHRVEQACTGGFHVELLKQGWARPMLNERLLLNLRHGAAGFVRQVRLVCRGEPWVFARTIIPRATLSGPRRRLARLGNKPLGAVLFADPGMRRGDLQLARIRPGEQLFATATRGLQPAPLEIWGRRSVFYLGGRPLLVSEIFLPGIRPCRRAGGGE